MPPKKQTSTEQILQKAFAITCAEGYEVLTARRLAKELGCSTQPIYLAFADMNGLKNALIQKAQATMINYILKNGDPSLPTDLANILAYVQFSGAEKNLFKLIFASGNASSPLVQALLPKELDINLNMAIYANGIVMMVAYNTLDFPWETIKALIVHAYEAFGKSKTQ